MTNRLTSILTKAKLMEINLEKDGKFRSFEPEIHYSYARSNLKIHIFFPPILFHYPLVTQALKTRDLLHNIQYIMSKVMMVKAKKWTLAKRV